MNTHIPRFLGTVAVVAVVLTTSADASAPAGRYQTTSATVYDTKTRLTWQRPAALSPTATWADAKTFCSLVVGTLVGGTGWRLPTLKELLTIVDYSQATAPIIDQSAFPGTPSERFWSSSPLAGSSSSAWSVYFYSGCPYQSAVSNLNYVRCVR